MMSRNEKIAIGAGFVTLGAAVAYLLLRKPTTLPSVKVQSGEVTFSYIPGSGDPTDTLNTPSGTDHTYVAFAEPFSTEPIVIITPAVFQATAFIAQNIDLNGFWAVAANHSSTPLGSSVMVKWAAIGTQNVEGG
jgi:hypothetical protein